MKKDIAQLLLSWDGYNRKEFSNPYIFSIAKADQELVYFGSYHCYDPKDGEFEIIRHAWSTFCERNVREKIAVVEGGRTEVKNSEEEAILLAGEMGFLAFLAHQKKIPIASFEPASESGTWTEISRQHSKEVVFYHGVVQRVLQWNELTQKPSFDDYIGDFMKKGQYAKKGTEWENFDFSFEHALRIHKNLFNADFDSTDENFLRATIDPAQHNGIINQISRDESLIRDVSMVEGILEEWGGGKSLFVICGSGHAVIQEPALRVLLG